MLVKENNASFLHFYCLGLHMPFLISGFSQIYMPFEFKRFWRHFNKPFICLQVKLIFLPGNIFKNLKKVITLFVSYGKCYP